MVRRVGGWKLEAGVGVVDSIYDLLSSGGCLSAELRARV